MSPRLSLELENLILSSNQTFALITGQKEKRYLDFLNECLKTVLNCF